MAITRIDTLRSLAFGGISGTYAAVGTPLAHAWSIFCITNNTDGDMFFSVDGTNNNIFTPAYSFRLYDLSTNAPPINVNDSLLMAVGTQFYVKQSTAPTVGSVYIEGVYAKGE